VQLALDVSNYSGEITDAHVACWRALGYEHLVCGTQRPDLTRRQLAVAVRGGLTVEAYVYLYWGDVVARVRRAVETVADLPVERLWLDCEDAPGRFSPPQIVAEIEAGLAACGSLPAGIYTGRWWWPTATGNSSRFAGLPLWHAEYLRSPDLLPDLESFQPYGGWVRPAMWQFQGTTTVCGVTVDRNLRAYVPPRQPPPSAAASLDLALLRFARALVGGSYVFRPVDAEQIELQRVAEGAPVSFEPPYLLRAP
jgi:hypothetical protein